jgi:ABC-type amino acid transport substrate-binding protein
MKKLFALILAVVMMLCAASVAMASADEPNSLEKVINAGVLKVGLDVGFAPMGFYEEGTDNIIGYDIDLANEVGARLGVRVEFVPIVWETKEMELANGTIDCVWNGMSITPERLKSMTISDAYLTNNIVILVHKDMAGFMEDLSGKKVGVQSGSVAEELLCEEYSDFASNVEVLSFEDYVAAIMDLKNGNLDAVIIDEVVANYQIQVMGLTDYITIECLAEDVYGVGFRKGDYMLCGAVEEALLDMANDGTLAAISTKWFGEDVALIGK